MHRPYNAKQKLFTSSSVKRLLSSNFQNVKSVDDCWRDSLRYLDKVDFLSTSGLARGKWVPSVIVQMHEDELGVTVELLLEGFNR